MSKINVEPVNLDSLKATIQQYRDYCESGMEFLLKRRRAFPDFPGVQTGYDSITGAALGTEQSLIPLSPPLDIPQDALEDGLAALGEAMDEALGEGDS